jgi:glycerol-3-phosphate cytidylyltransferase-like family protein
LQFERGRELFIGLSEKESESQRKGREKIMKECERRELFLFNIKKKWEKHVEL